MLILSPIKKCIIGTITIYSTDIKPAFPTLVKSKLLCCAMAAKSKIKPIITPPFIPSLKLLVLKILSLDLILFLFIIKKIGIRKIPPSKNLIALKVLGPIVSIPIL